MTDNPVGFIGLGIMGKPMSKNLLKGGYRLVVHNRSPQAVKELVSLGAQAAASPKEVAQRTQIVFTMLPDSPDVEQVVLGAQGIIEGVQGGSLVVDMSTISPQVTRQLAQRLREKGADMLDAPVTGGEAGAIAGTLTIMVGGEEAAFSRALPLLQGMGRKVVRVGSNGMGQTVKLANQIVCGLNLMAMSEGLVFAARAGADLEQVVDIIGSGVGGSWMMQNLAPRAIKGDFAPGFKAKLQLKDLRLALEAAGSLELPLPGTGLVRQFFGSLQAKGHGEEGTQALIRVLEDMGNVLARVPGAPR